MSANAVPSPLGHVAVHLGPQAGQARPFSLDRLFRFLYALGRDIKIVIRPAMQNGEVDYGSSPREGAFERTHLL